MQVIPTFIFNVHQLDLNLRTEETTRKNDQTFIGHQDRNNNRTFTTNNSNHNFTRNNHWNNNNNNNNNWNKSNNNH